MNNILVSQHKMNSPEFEKELAEFLNILDQSSVYPPAAPSPGEVVKLTRWRVFEVRDEENIITRHFVGRTNGEGRVSSEIKSYDSNTKSGITKSGRVYQLVYESGRDMNAAHVFHTFKAVNKITEVVDVSEEYK